MNYKLINNSVVKANRFGGSIKKDTKLYRYLLDNNIAYYYSHNISDKKNKYENDIIRSGNNLNAKYFNTLKAISEACRKENIEFILFKTYKHISEAVDGDIDIFVKEKDFYSFLNIMKDAGFNCEVDEKLKASCKKPGFSIIEPRVTVSFLGKVFIREETIWNNVELAKINGLQIKTSTKELDIFFMLLNVLYGPNYFKLYSYIVFEKVNLEKLFSLSPSHTITSDLRLIINELTKSNVLDQRFPIFPKDIVFMQWWLKRALQNKKISNFRKIKHMLFFVYAKYGYKLFNTLPFRHDWNLKYV